MKPVPLFILSQVKPEVLADIYRRAEEVSKILGANTSANDSLVEYYAIEMKEPLVVALLEVIDSIVISEGVQNVLNGMPENEQSFFTFMMQCFDREYLNTYCTYMCKLLIVAAIGARKYA